MPQRARDDFELSSRKPHQRLSAISEQILPIGIGSLDQLDFPLTAPLLKAFLGRQRFIHISEAFRIDEPERKIFLGEPRAAAIAMLVDSAGKLLVTPV